MVWCIASNREQLIVRPGQACSQRGALFAAVPGNCPPNSESCIKIFPVDQAFGV